MTEYCSNCKHEKENVKNVNCAKCYTDKKFNYEYSGHEYLSEECKTCKRKFPIWCSTCPNKR